MEFHMSQHSTRQISASALRQASKDLNLTVAAIAEGTGLSKAYISEFRNETRNLSATQQEQLRAYLESQYAEKGLTFPDDGEQPETELLQGLGNMVKRISRPAIMLSEDVPKAQADKLLDLIEANRLKVSDLLNTEFQSGGIFGGEFSGETEGTIRELFALLALNYVAVLMLQGRNIASKPSKGLPPKTIGDWLSTYLDATPISAMLPASEASDELEAA